MALILIAAAAATKAAAAMATAHTHWISYCVFVCIYWIRACVYTEDAKLPVCISRIIIEYICLLEANHLSLCAVSFFVLNCSKNTHIFFAIVQLVDLFGRFFTSLIQKFQTNIYSKFVFVYSDVCFFVDNTISLRQTHLYECTHTVTMEVIKLYTILFIDNRYAICK